LSYFCALLSLIERYKQLANMKKILVFIAFAACMAIVSDLQAQSPENLWKTLGKITFKKQYDELLGFKVDVPVFSQEIIAMEGKIVTVKGYIIPVDGYKSHKEFVFSAYPYNMCFFCGGAGPETVMEVYAKEPIKYTAEPVTIKGKLELNSTDVNRLIYALNDVILLTPGK